MTTIDFSALLNDVPGAEPCGPNLEHEQVFRDLMLLAQERSGGGIIDTQDHEPETDYRAVRRQAEALLALTKDLRVATMWAKAVLHTDGLSGLQAGLALCRHLLEQHWEAVHPQLDPDDGHDPTFRLNVLSEFCDHESYLLPLRRTPLVSLRGLGSFSYRDVALATGKMKLPEGASETPPSEAEIDAAFRDCDLDALSAATEALELARQDLQAIEAFVTSKVGIDDALRLPELSELLDQMIKTVAPRLQARQQSEPGGEQAGASEPAQAGNGVRGAPLASGTVNSREDVVRLLDKICDYYERREPSSPIPVLLRRCKRLVPMQFKDIVKELVPDGMSQFEVIRGPEETDGA